MQTIDELIAYHQSILTVLQEAKQTQEQLTSTQEQLNTVRQTLLQIDGMIDEENI